MKVLDETQPAAGDRHFPLDREWAADREIDIFSGLLFLWRRRYAVLLGIVIGAALGLAVALFTPKEYRATATLVVRSVPLESPRAAGAMSIDTLDQLANSESVRGRVAAELSRRNLTQAGGRILGFRTVVHKSSDPERPTIPMLALTVAATSPQLSRDAANVWSEVLTAATRSLEDSKRSEAVAIVTKEYPKAAERLTEQERVLEGIKREHQEALQNARMRAGISLKEAQLASHERLLVDLEEERQRLALTLKQTEAGIAALEQELKPVNPVLDLERSAAAGASSSDARPRSQELNPVYTALAEKVADARVRYRELTARQSALDAQVNQLRRSASAARAALSASELSIANLELRQETEVFAKEREVAVARATYDRLEQHVSDAELLTATEGPAVQPGTAAEVPTSASGPGALRNILLGALLGLGVVLLGAWFVETARSRGVRLT